MADPLYPDVPNAAGVPNVLRLVGSGDDGTNILMSDDTGIAASAPQWGIFDANGAPLIDVDLVASVEFQAESTISDFPIEQGSFQSYNKVDRPYSVRVRVAKSGKSVDRTSFLQALEALKASVDVCNIVTPERLYPNANVVRYDYQRSATEGAQMIVAELQVEEIRQSATATYSNTKTPDGADPVNTGSVQAIQIVPDPPTTLPVTQAQISFTPIPAL